MADDTIDGEVFYEDDEGQGVGPGRQSNAADRFWNGSEEFELAPPPFGELLINIRGKISARLKHNVSQDEFGTLLGDVDQVTISRWQRGTQKPQLMQLEKIVALAQEYGMNLTLARLQQSLNYDQKSYSLLDPRLRRLDALLANEDEAFRDEFYEVVVGLLHMLKGVRRNRGL